LVYKNLLGFGKQRDGVILGVLVRLFYKSLIGTVPPASKGLTYSSPYPTPLPPTMASEEKGPWQDLSKDREEEGYLQNLPSYLRDFFSLSLLGAVLKIYHSP
jgi:hypothetical protein